MSAIEAEGDTDPATVRPGDTVQGYLRRATRAWHEAVEAGFAPYDLATAGGLGGFLRQQAKAVLPLEHALEGAGIAHRVPDWAARRRTAALLADLHGLGLAPAEPASVPPLPSMAYAMGILYVLEGSKLGGRVLLRRVLASPDPRVRAASRFLGHHQPGGWASFLALLNGQPLETDSLATARSGAETAFGLFRAAAESDMPGEALGQPPSMSLVHFAHA